MAQGRTAQFRSLFSNPQLLLVFIINVVVAQNQTLNTSLFSLFASNLGASPSETGALVFLSNATATLLMIPSGILAEKVGRGRMILFSVCLSTASTFSYTLVTSWQQLLVPAMLLSASNALFLPSRMTLISDYSTPQNRATIYSFMNIAWPIGAIYGPVIGGMLADAFPGWKVPFYFMSLTSLLCILPAFLLREEAKPRSTISVRAVPTHRIGMLYVVLPLYLLHLFMELGIMAVDPYMSLYLEKRFNVTKTQVGVFYGLGFGFATLLPQIPAGYLADRYGRKKLMIICAAALAPVYLLCSLAGDYVTLMVFYMLINAIWSMTWPISMAILIDTVPSSAKEFAVGVRQTFIRLGATIGPLAGGFIWNFGGDVSIFYLSAVFVALSVPPMIVQHQE